MIARRRPPVTSVKIDRLRRRKWIDGLLDAVSDLKTFPQKGRMVPEVGRTEIREVLYGQYRVIYRLEEKRLFILTVRHQRRQFSESILREEQ